MRVDRGWLMVVGFGLGCAPVAAPERVAPRGPDVVAPALPPIPERDEALRLEVMYPPEGGTITARDSTFVFGSTGTGRAQLRINGVAVRVEPNGAFLGFLPVPADGIYRFHATRTAESTQLERRTRVPAPLPSPNGAEIHVGSGYPRGAVALPRGEPMEVGFRGSPGGQAWLRLPTGERIPLVETRALGDARAQDFEVAPGAAPPARISTYRGMVMVQSRWLTRDTAIARPRLATASQAAAPAEPATSEPSSAASAEAVFELVVGADTARRPLPLNLVPLDPAAPAVAVAQSPPAAPSDWMVRGRNSPAGPFHYFWPAGTRLQVTGERNDMYRVRLAADLSAWVPVADMRLLPAGTPPPRATVGGARMTPHQPFIDLRIPLSERLPFHVELGERALRVDVFGATSEVNFFQYGGVDPLIDRAAWTQPSSDVFRVDIALTEPVWGYETFFDATGSLIVRIRRPPGIDAERPLAGLLIAVDPGHPPGGAIGPTGLTEAQANLWIAQRLQPMLEAAGARVLMTRTDDEAVDLAARPRMAREANAHLLVSIHNNAFPDGVNPFINNGTSTYYFHPHSVDLARHLQRELLQELGLRDIGIGRADLALVRGTWMPATLTETAFLMIPEQEAALRDARVQERIARAHLRAIEAFLRARAAARS